MPKIAGRGPAPKEPEKRKRRNAPREMEQIEATARATQIPKLPGAEHYGERTKAWYETWASSAIASRFTSTDWQRLFMLAPLVSAYFTEPTTSLLAEIRLNEAKLGATLEDRLRLQIRITTGSPDREEAEAGARRRPQRRKRVDPRTKLAVVK